MRKNTAEICLQCPRHNKLQLTTKAPYKVKGSPHTLNNPPSSHSKQAKVVQCFKPRLLELEKRDRQERESESECKKAVLTSHIMLTIECAYMCVRDQTRAAGRDSRASGTGWTILREEEKERETDR